MSPSPDVLVLGGGIVGAACALECARAGMRVAIVEAGAIGGGASAAGMGHIVVMDDSPAQLALTRFSQQLWNELEPALPPSVEYGRSGTIWVAADEEEMGEVRRKRDLYAAHGVPAAILDERELAQAEPHMRAGLAGGLLVPEDGVIYPPCAARLFVDQTLALGGRLHQGKAAARITGQGAVLSDGSHLAAGVVVNALGSWAASLSPGVAIQRRKGHLVITDRYPGTLRHQLVELGYLKSAHSLESDSVAFNVQPRPTGQLLIGSSRQYGDEDPAIDHAILGKMLARACEYMPAVGALMAIRAWTGFRAATPDKLPLIGPAPEQPNVYLATGHEGLGITTSLATARLLADQLLGRPPTIPIEPYLPNRSARMEIHHG